MRFAKLALLPLAAILLSASPVAAQNEGSAVLRLQLPSPILFTGVTPEDPEEPDPVGNGPPTPGGNSGPLDIVLPEGLRNWATVGDAFGELRVVGGLPPYTSSVLLGTLPTGLSLVDNQIQGYYGARGIYTFALGAKDASNPQKSDGTDTIQIDVADPLAIGSYPASVIQATAGVSLEVVAPTTTGGTPPYAYSATGAVGTLDPSTGIIAITPSAAGALGPIQLSVSDQHDRLAETNSVSINVSNPLDASSPTNAPLRVGKVGTIAAPIVTGGRGQRGFSLASGSVPPGMTLGSDGRSTGTPTQPCTACSYQVRVTDADSRTDISSVPFTVVGALQFSSQPAGLYNWRFNVPITPVQLTTTNSLAALTVAATGAGLPPGLTLTADGTTATISGTPTGTYASTSTSIQASDGDGVAFSNNFTYTVTRPGITGFLTTELGEAGTAWTKTPGYENYVGGRTYTLTNAPAGLTVTNGVLNWATPVQGNYPGIVLRVTDSQGSYGDAGFALNITAAAPKDGGTTTATNAVSGNGDFGNPRVVTWSYPYTVFVDRMKLQVKAYKSGGTPKVNFKLEKADAAGGPWTTVVTSTIIGSASATSSTNAVFVGPTNLSIGTQTGRYFKMTYENQSGTNSSGSAPGIGTAAGWQN